MNIKHTFNEKTLQKLEFLANAASNGKWKYLKSYESELVRIMATESSERTTIVTESYISEVDAKYICATDPQTIKQLITELRNTKKELENTKNLLNTFRTYSGTLYNYYFKD